MIKVKLLPLAILSFVIIIFLPHLSSGQNDSLVTVKDLYFHSEFEKEQLLGIVNGSSKDYLALYLSVDSTVERKEYESVKQSIKIKTEAYSTPSFAKSREDKQVKKIYKEVHEEFLVKYDEDALFSTTFQNMKLNSHFSSWKKHTS